MCLFLCYYEYTMFKEVQKLTKNIIKSTIIFFIMGIFLVVLGCSLFVSMANEEKPQLITYSDSVQMNNNDVYYLGKAAVITQYASLVEENNEDNVFSSYYVIALGDEINGYSKIASLKIDSTDPVFDRLELIYSSTDYIPEEPTFIDLCATKFSLSSKALGFYQEATSLLQSAVPGIENSGLELEFYCEGTENFEETSKTDNSGLIFVASALLLFGILCIIEGIISTINKKKKLIYLQNLIAQNYANIGNYNNFNTAPNNNNYSNYTSPESPDQQQFYYQNPTDGSDSNYNNNNDYSN